MDIYSFPLYYISFDRKPKLEETLKNLGYKNINLFKAVDGNKLDKDQLYRDRKISMRVHYDLIQYCDFMSMPSMRGIGCALSHQSLWQKCIDDNMDYIIIAEDDLILKRLDKDDMDFIVDGLSKPNSIFIGSKYANHIHKLPSIVGLQFYIMSNQACKNALKYAYPIDTQLDTFLTYIYNLGIVNIYIKKVSSQAFHLSSIQKIHFPFFMNRPVKCIFVICILIIILLMYFSLRYIKCCKTRR